MISAYLGMMGSGKSLHTAKDIRFYLGCGSLVIANFAIDLTKIKVHKKSKFIELSSEQLEYPQTLINVIREYQGENGYRHVFIVLDECQELFDSREWKRLGRKEWLLFFKEHRKICHDKGDVILCTQDKKCLDKRLQSIVEFDYWHHNVGNFGLVGFILDIFFLGRLFQYTKYWNPVRKEVESKFYLCRKKYYGIYDTLKLFNVS